MQNTTRTRVATTALSALLLVACDGTPPAREQVAADSAAADTTRSGAAAWRALEIAAPDFRAFGWGAGDTLWGIDRGHLAWAAPDGTRARLDAVAWDVQTAPGVVSWTNEAGLWRRTAAGPHNLVAPDDGPGPEYTGPEVLWSPDGSRALLTWMGEAMAERAVVEGDSLRRLTASLPGMGGAADAMWVDRQRVVVRVVAFGPLSGPAEYRESGYRADLAELDVAADRVRLITRARDGEFFSTEGVLRGDTLLAGVREEGGVPRRHALIDTRTGRTTGPPIPSGRAAAAHGLVALLRPQGEAAAEQAWQLELIAGAGAAARTLDVRGYAVRLIWHPEKAVLAVAQESETAGYRTWIVSRE